jgi:hypothetical protein
MESDIIVPILKEILFQLLNTENSSQESIKSRLRKVGLSEKEIEDLMN